MSRFTTCVLRCLKPLANQRVSSQTQIKRAFCLTAAARQKEFKRSASTATPEEDAPRNFLFETRGSSKNRLSSEPEKARLVIFDKDGTLICFHTMWSEWAVKVTESIASQVGLPLEEKLYEALGVCAKSKRVFPGLLAEMTTQNIQQELIKLLVKEGVSKEDARQAVLESWREGDSGKGDKSVRSIHPDLRTLFKILKSNDIKIAICTADNRRGSLNTLKHLGLIQYVDMVVCGDDPNTQAKPAPHNAWKICGQLGVDPQEACMVGDTKADVGMGQAAKLGWVVGVLSGVGDTEELLPEAHYIIDNVKDLLPLIMPYDDWVNCYTYSSHERVLCEPLDLDPSPEGDKVDPICMENYDVVIFDLHGTLVCTDNKYLDWLEKLTSRLEHMTGLNLAPQIYQHLGVSYTDKKVQPGLLASGAHLQLKEALVNMLRKLGFHFEEAIITVNQAWSECEEAVKTADVVALDKNIHELFRTLKENGVRIAINTSESRETAVNDLRALNLTSFVDMMVCGDDPMSRLKPSGHNPSLICEEMGTVADKAVVVGDTLEDISMGLNAKVGLTIGVLTGVGSHKELVQADHIVPSVSDILAHLTSEGDNSTPANKSTVAATGRRLFSTSSKSGSHTPVRSFFSSTSERNLIGSKPRLHRGANSGLPQGSVAGLASRLT